MFGLGTTELLLIFGTVVLLFGAKRIPGLAKSIGESIRGFRGALSEGEKKDGQGTPNG